jgi:hypothetical protein
MIDRNQWVMNGLVLLMQQWGSCYAPSRPTALPRRTIVVKGVWLYHATVIVPAASDDPLRYRDSGRVEPNLVDIIWIGLPEICKNCSQSAHPSPRGRTFASACGPQRDECPTVDRRDAGYTGYELSRGTSTRQTVGEARQGFQPHRGYHRDEGWCSDCKLTGMDHNDDELRQWPQNKKCTEKRACDGPIPSRSPKVSRTTQNRFWTSLLDYKLKAQAGNF